MDVLKPVTVLQENVRASTEKAITVFRGQYAEVKTMAETATSQLEDSMKAAQEGSRALGFKLFEIAKAQTQAHLDHAKTLAATKSLPELLTAQQSFLVAQIEMAQSRSKDVAALAGKVANDVTAPLRASLNLLLRR
ncbi:MAG: phasin family protein [Methylobacterium sp.]|nr:phasin family protein [Methylobacterium sp.]MCA3680434.1 phasin family protein [Methylobacterium sp.]MCA3701879.1 phasin family protein [Methylobacterium sp.]